MVELGGVMSPASLNTATAKGAPKQSSSAIKDEIETVLPEAQQ
jgi:hypothetical protein